MAESKDVKFTVAGTKFPAYGVLAVVPDREGCQVRWASGRTQYLRGITSQEVMFKIEEAKAHADSD
jgi:hypothetical protein